jgi:hypothetical protein
MIFFVLRALSEVNITYHPSLDKYPHYIQWLFCSLAYYDEKFNHNITKILKAYIR